MRSTLHLTIALIVLALAAAACGPRYPVYLARTIPPASEVVTGAFESCAYSDDGLRLVFRYTAEAPVHHVDLHDTELRRVEVRPGVRLPILNGIGLSADARGDVFRVSTQLTLKEGVRLPVFARSDLRVEIVHKAALAGVHLNAKLDWEALPDQRWAPAEADGLALVFSAPRPDVLRVHVTGPPGAWLQISTGGRFGYFAIPASGSRWIAFEARDGLSVKEVEVDFYDRVRRVTFPMRVDGLSVERSCRQ